MSCYELAMEFKRKFPSTIAWRIFQNSKVVDQHVNPDENITYAFVGQKNESPFDIFQTAAIAITNKRIISMNVQGITGKKVDYTSIPYSKIQVFSIETSGTLDLDSELDVTISGLGTIRFELSAQTDTKKLGQFF